MKKSIKILGALLVVVMVALTSACTVSFNLDGGNKTTKAEKKEEKGKGKCKYYECLYSLKLDYSIDKITETIGFEPTAGENKYTYDFGNGKELVVNTSSSSGSNVTIKIEYDKEDLKNSKVDLSKLQDIKANMNKGDGVNYNDFVKQVGNVEGTLIELGMWNKYVWVAGDGKSYINASFRPESGKCMFMSGMTY